jgi:hypothetical protein
MAEASHINIALRDRVGHGDIVVRQAFWSDTAGSNARHGPLGEVHP